MARIVIRIVPSDGKPGKVTNKDRPLAFLNFTANDLAPEIDIASLQDGDEVDYDLAGTQVINLRPLHPRPAAATELPHAAKPTDSPPSIPPEPTSAPIASTQDDSPTVPPPVDAPTTKTKPTPPAQPTSGHGQIAARACNQFPTSNPMLGSKADTPAPYTCVRVRKGESGVSAYLDKVVTHDGAATEGLLTGELDMELTALTPVLAGQFRYGWRKLRTDDDKQLIDGPFKDGKKILEPAIIARTDAGPAVVPSGREIPEAHWEDRRTIIPSTSIKGQVRQAVGAMLNAPMERVGERRMSYRPNVDTTTNIANRSYQCFAAVVTKVHPDRSATVRLLRDLRKVLFVESPGGHGLSPMAEAQLEPTEKQGSSGLIDSRSRRVTQNQLRGGEYVDGFERGESMDGHPLPRLEYKPKSKLPWRVDWNRYVCHYACGIDGDFELAGMTKALHERGESDGGAMTARHYFRALVPSRDEDYFDTAKTIGTDLIAIHDAMRRDLVDRKVGHFSRLPRGLWGRDLTDAEIDKRKDEVKKKIQDNDLQPYQLIYVEATLLPNGEPDKVVSFGTHFRYRWPYTSSVREINIDPATGHGQVRDILKPTAGEGIKPDDDGRASGELSGARLLFGYAADKATATNALGENSFARLAGRVAFNHAVEVIEPDQWQPQKRFLHFDGLQGDARFLVPLRILGTPKPTAVEHYIQQDGIESRPGATTTYGDLPGDPGGELNGRKFYRHFDPKAAANGRLTGAEAFLAEDDEVCRSDQATLARFISRPGTRFRLRLRFRDLRPWELGALLVAMDPNLLTDVPETELPTLLKDHISKVKSEAGDTQQPLFAQKLGYGRPLGLGSVRIQPKAARLLGNTPVLTAQADPTSFALCQVRAFLTAISGRETALMEWLTVSRFAQQPQSDYPRKSKGQERDKIYIYHSDIRILHAKKRRSADVGGETPDKRIWPDITSRPA